jgi:hypothetical protein
VVRRTVYGFCVNSWKGIASNTAIYGYISSSSALGDRDTYWIIKGRDGKEGDPDGENRIRGRGVAVVGIFGGITPSHSSGAALVNDRLDIHKELWDTYWTSRSNSCRKVTFWIWSKFRLVCLRTASLWVLMSFFMFAAARQELLFADGMIVLTYFP